MMNFEIYVFCTGLKNKIIITMLTGIILLSPGNVSAEAFTYKDKLERMVTVQVPVKRAILLTSSDLLPVTGAWDRVAGVSHGASEDNDLLKAVKPDLAQLIPSVGNNHNINIEVLLRLNPDIVLAWSSKQDIINYLDKKKVPVIAVSPESIAELYEVMRMQGRLFGSEKNVESAIVRMEEMFDLIRKRVAAVPADQRKKALWVAGKPTTISGGISINNDLLSVVGQENIGGEIKQRSTDVSLEQIAAWNPDVIYIWGRARYSAADILNNPQWRHIKAVKEHRVFKVPKWDTWSPRLAPLALWMAAAVYPKQFEDIDITKTIDKFYRDVYNIPYAKVRQIEN